MIAQTLNLDPVKHLEQINFIFSIAHGDTTAWMESQGINPRNMNPTQIIALAKAICKFVDIADKDLCPIVNGLDIVDGQ